MPGARGPALLPLQSPGKGWGPAAISLGGSVPQPPYPLLRLHHPACHCTGTTLPAAAQALNPRGKEGSEQSLGRQDGACREGRAASATSKLRSEGASGLAS